MNASSQQFHSFQLPAQPAAALGITFGLEFPRVISNLVAVFVVGQQYKWCNSHQGLSLGILIWDIHQGLSFGMLIRVCHHSSGIVIRNCLGFLFVMVFRVEPNVSRDVYLKDSEITSLSLYRFNSQGLPLQILIRD